MTRLALCLNKNNKANEAEGLFRQVLNHRQALLGRKHPQVAAAALNLAACLYGQGCYAAAAKMYGAALEVRKSALGDQHADTAACMHNLALCKSR
jgi:tetratricopeptide (TPR) repeat protein